MVVYSMIRLCFLSLVRLLRAHAMRMFFCVQKKEIPPESEMARLLILFFVGHTRTIPQYQFVTALRRLGLQ